jgi:hypothetical protein
MGPSFDFVLSLLCFGWHDSCALVEKAMACLSAIGDNCSSARLVSHNNKFWIDLLTWIVFKYVLH